MKPIVHGVAALYRLECPLGPAGAPLAHCRALWHLVGLFPKLCAQLVPYPFAQVEFATAVG